MLLRASSLFLCLYCTFNVKLIDSRWDYLFFFFFFAKNYGLTDYML